MAGKLTLLYEHPEMSPLDGVCTSVLPSFKSFSSKATSRSTSLPSAFKTFCCTCQARERLLRGARLDGSRGIFLELNRICPWMFHGFSHEKWAGSCKYCRKVSNPLNGGRGSSESYGKSLLGRRV